MTTNDILMQADMATVKELRGASSSLGFRSMWKILREKYLVHIILKGMPHCFTIAAWVAAMITCMHC